MSVIVQKYGGMSLATETQVGRVADRVAELQRAGHRVVVVVSAMADTTDRLIQMARLVSRNPIAREVDMLVSAGERISMALLSIALNDRGSPAVSFTGSQAGILTESKHGLSRLRSVQGRRIEEALDQGKTVVLAGFQGVSPETKEITTLGRGGTDLTAVAVAFRIGAQICEILKEVDGVLSADPRICPRAKTIPRLSYEEALDMTFWGAKVLNHRSVELAAFASVPLHVGHALEPTDSGGTTLGHFENRRSFFSADTALMETTEVLVISSHKEVLDLSVSATGSAQALARLSVELEEIERPLPQVLYCEPRSPGAWTVGVTAPATDLATLRNHWNSSSSTGVQIQREISSVSAICRGSTGNTLSHELASFLEARGIHVLRVLFQPLTISFFVPPEARESAVQALHEKIGSPSNPR